MICCDLLWHIQLQKNKQTKVLLSPWPKCRFYLLQEAQSDRITSASSSCRITLQRGLGWHLVTSRWLFNRYEEKPRCSVGFISPRAAHTQQRKLRCGASQVSHDTPGRPRGSEGNANVTPAQLCQTNELCCCGVIPSKAHDLWATKTGPQQECIVLHEVGLSLCCLISTDPRASATWQSVSVFTTKRLWHWCIGCQTRRRTNTPHKKCF